VPRTLVMVAVAALVGVGATLAVSGDGADVPTQEDAAAAPEPTPTAVPSEERAPGKAPAAAQPVAGGLVIWARGDLPRAFAEAVAATDGVVAATHVRSGTLGLVGARPEDGPSEVLADGFRIPVSVAAVDPVAYARTLPAGTDRDTVAGLAPGRTLLSETAARLRGVDAGGRIDLAGLPGLEVAGIVADGAVGRAEIVLHEADAAAAGLDDDGTVYVRHDATPGAATDRLVAAIETLVPAEVTARIVDVAAGLPRRRAPLVLSLAEVKDRFGEFAYRPRSGVREIDLDPAFRDEHIVSVEVPILGTVTCHRGIVDDLGGALGQLADAGLAGEIDPARYGGCYHPRRISTAGDGLSRHAWGIAIDINVDLSLPGGGPSPHPEVIRAFEAHGFRWGGDFLHPDNHHFEWIGDAATATTPS
jgi:hypothetical protein